MMEYTDALTFLDGLKRSKIKMRLEATRYLLLLLGDPHRDMRIIHVAGTNGKGSVCAVIASILVENNFMVGLYTSPHLEDFRQRIQVNGEMIAGEDVVDLVERIKPLVEEMGETGYGKPTFFEVVTAMGLLYFSGNKVDFAVMEVGLGGRLDATNVVNPLVSVLTDVELDHTSILGDSIQEIAGEKAGIIKDGGLVVSGVRNMEAVPVIQGICNERSARLYELGRDFFFEELYSGIDGQVFNFTNSDVSYGRLWIPLLGRHQLRNVSVAIEAVESLREHGIDTCEDAMREGLRRVRWSGRMELVGDSPSILLDGAHNPPAMRELRESISRLFKRRRIILVMGVSAHKDMPAMVREISPVVDLVVVTSFTGRSALDPREIEGEFKIYGKEAVVVESAGDAVEYAKRISGRGDLILITGSLFLVGEVRECLGIQG